MSVKPKLSRRQWIAGAAAVMTMPTLLTACGGGGSDAADRKNLVTLAESKPELSLFVEAVNAAGLRDTLSSGSYTVFAPDNNAFAALLAELGTTKDALFADTALLGAVLKYHVLSSVVFKEAIPLGKAIEPIGGGFFKIELQGNAYQITDGRNRTSAITSTDSVAANGVLHVVNRVLLPANKDIVETAQATADLSILVEAVVAAGLVDSLKAPGPFTVFAPTNAAFAALLTELGVTKQALLADNALLTKVLTYHVVPSRTLKADIRVDSPITTLQGQTFRVNANLRIVDQRNRTTGLVATDVFASNGVVHVIDRVLLPA
ncbi:fasciclin domain-containing protein [Variovorax dokdonensis]|uniref:Fasciclin domain-containing protein n=1 Tax=Variovorax dokdonensis TaxID=344883 RepID=A0ABT7N985_9BURK|nr:fasciclin domain-containing protein [Variovorax dokdonensis]MDM0044506.1 fasciclin domain-containing protein [Variovorax dokdonensis]